MSREPFARFRAAVLETPKDFAEWNVVIVAFGDSVTQGLMVNPQMAGEDVYHAVLRRELHRAFPERTFSTINAGINGKSVRGVLSRLENSVLRHQPHLTVIGFGLNDSSAGDEGLPEFGKNLAEIVTKVLDAGSAVVLMTPNMMAARDNGHVDGNYRHAFDDIMRRQTSGILSRYADAIRQAAASLCVPVADVYAEWERRQAAGEDMMMHLSNGLNHPDVYGHRLAGEVLFRAVLAELRR